MRKISFLLAFHLLCSFVVAQDEYDGPKPDVKKERALLHSVHIYFTSEAVASKTKTELIASIKNELESANFEYIGIGTKGFDESDSNY